MYPLPHSFIRAERDAGLIWDIAKAISGQYNAIACYAKLAKLAPCEKQKKRILEIRQDEVRHYQVFTQIYMRLTGQQPRITPEPCPDTYVAGLEFAVEDELETVDFYLDISEKATDPFIKRQFARAAADEQNHATWFLYFLMKAKKRCGCSRG